MLQSCMSFCTEPHGPRARIIHAGQEFPTAGVNLTVDLVEGSTGPTFTCLINTTQATAYTWRMTTGNYQIPNGVSVSQHSIADSQNIVSSLIWNRAIAPHDSNTYLCEATTNKGASNATLELSVIRK